MGTMYGQGFVFTQPRFKPKLVGLNSLVQQLLSISQSSNQFNLFTDICNQSKL